MRGDITAAQERMEIYLDEAQAAIPAGDPEHAKKSLSNAEREIDKLDGSSAVSRSPAPDRR